MWSENKAEPPRVAIARTSDCGSSVFRPAESIHATEVKPQSLTLARAPPKRKGHASKRSMKLAVNVAAPFESPTSDERGTIIIPLTRTAGATQRQAVQST